MAQLPEYLQVQVTQIEAIDLTELPAFKSGLERNVKRARDPHFQPVWNNQNTEKMAELQMRRSCFEKFEEWQRENSLETPHEGVDIYGLWHGTRSSLAPKIARYHFTTIGEPEEGSAKTKITDKGYWGKGYYFTSEAEYAYTYAEISVLNSAAKDLDTFCLLYSFVSAREPYPVIKGDQSRLQEKGHMYAHDSHWIPVHKVENQDGTTDYVACDCTQDVPWFHELCAFDTAQILPAFIVYLDKKSSHAFEECLELIRCEQLEELKPLLDKDPSLLEKKNSFGENLAHYALYFQHLEILKELHSRRAGIITEVTKEGRSFPFLASLTGNKDIVNWVLENSLLPYDRQQLHDDAIHFNLSAEDKASILCALGWSSSPPSSGPPSAHASSASFPASTFVNFQNFSANAPGRMLQVIANGNPE